MLGKVVAGKFSSSGFPTAREHMKCGSSHRDGPPNAKFPPGFPSRALKVISYVHFPHY